MSYGRMPPNPCYIWGGKTHLNFWGPHGEWHAEVPYDAIAQFVARMAARGDEEINKWIQRGVALDPDAFSDDFRVTVTGGWRPYDEDDEDDADD